MEGKELLSSSVTKHFRSVQKQLLDIAEFVVPEQFWKQFRSKLLGITNDFCRELLLEVENKYDITIKPNQVYDNIIEITSVKSQSINRKERNE